MAPKRTNTSKKRLVKARAPSAHKPPTVIRKVPQFPDYCDEVAYDKHGRPTYTKTGYKLTPRGASACADRLRIWTECHPPFIALPPEYYPKEDSKPKELPTLLWGIPFTHEQAADYAKRHGMGEISKLNLPFLVLTNLIRYTGIKIRCALPLTLKHQYLVVLYENWSLQSGIMSEEREAHAVKVIQRELKSNFEPMWWWDRGRNPM
ncbi:hypothetical protein C8Q75DRAFT_761647 [Abortiporus biennis]|nr:hypothetical protein C8Q75DRAFT_761647 [Abortiporus biennis]